MGLPLRLKRDGLQHDGTYGEGNIRIVNSLIIQWPGVNSLQRSGQWLVVSIQWVSGSVVRTDLLNTDLLNTAQNGDDEGQSEKGQQPVDGVGEGGAGGRS